MRAAHNNIEAKRSSAAYRPAGKQIGTGEEANQMPRKKVQGKKKMIRAVTTAATKKVKPEKIKQVKPKTAAAHPKG